MLTCYHAMLYFTSEIDFSFRLRVRLDSLTIPNFSLFIQLSLFITLTKYTIQQATVYFWDLKCFFLHLNNAYVLVILPISRIAA